MQWRGAGLFAALTLAEAGVKVVLLERGQPVEGRGRDIGALFVRRQLSPDSNLCYGLSCTMALLCVCITASTPLSASGSMWADLFLPLHHAYIEGTQDVGCQTEMSSHMHGVWGARQARAGRAPGATAS